MFKTFWLSGAPSIIWAKVASEAGVNKTLNSARVKTSRCCWLRSSTANLRASASSSEAGVGLANSAIILENGWRSFDGGLMAFEIEKLPVTGQGMNEGKGNVDGESEKLLGALIFICKRLADLELKG